MSWVVSWDDSSANKNPPCRYECDTNWLGINLFGENVKREYPLN